VLVAVDAGDVDAGDVDAGDVDAGDVDAGDVDAGDVDAGDVDAGDVDAEEGDPVSSWVGSRRTGRGEMMSVARRLRSAGLSEGEAAVVRCLGARSIWAVSVAQ